MSSEHAPSEPTLLDLLPEDVPGLFALCPGCVYWELPREHSPSRLGTEETKHLKTEWLRRHGADGRLGKVLRIGNDLRAFIQYGPPALYPQRLSYASGPVSDDAMLITCLYVAKPERGRGHGSALLGAAEAAARTLGYHAVEAFAHRGPENNPPGPLPLYLSRGYDILRDNDEYPLVRKELL